MVEGDSSLRTPNEELNLLIFLLFSHGVSAAVVLFFVDFRWLLNGLPPFVFVRGSGSVGVVTMGRSVLDGYLKHIRERDCGVSGDLNGGVFAGDFRRRWLGKPTELRELTSVASRIYLVISKLSFGCSVVCSYCLRNRGHRFFLSVRCER